MSAWQPIKTAPRDGSYILLYSRIHGVLQSYFAPGRWREIMEGREYEGPVWIVGDDLHQFEVEESESGFWDDPDVTHWMPIPQLPKE